MYFFIFVFNFFLVILKGEKVVGEPSIITSFSVVGKDKAFFKAKINNDNTITIKVSPYVNATEVLKSAVPTFYLSKGATVSPDPGLPQNFAQVGGVKYTVTAEDKVTKKEYTVSWGTSDHLADGKGFSYAEIGTTKNFVELGYPGVYNNFNLADSKLYGDLNMYHAYCGDYIVLLSRAYVTSDVNSPHALKVIDKTTLQPAGTFNLGPIAIADLMMISSDYKGRCVGTVVKNGETEFFYWAKPTGAPTSIGKISINAASTTDGSSNFQVAGDIAGNAWITAMAPRTAKGPHYRIKVTGGKLASNYSTIETGYSSTDCSGFYWVTENAYTSQVMLPIFKSYILTKGKYTFYHIPYWGASLRDNWTKFGFDISYQQPNVYFHTTRIVSVKEVINYAKDKGHSLEFEFDENVLKSRGFPKKREIFMEYFNEYEANGIFENYPLTYYQLQFGWALLVASTEPEDLELSKKLGSTIVKRQKKADAMIK